MNNLTTEQEVQVYNLQKKLNDLRDLSARLLIASPPACYIQLVPEDGIDAQYIDRFIEAKKNLRDFVSTL